MYIILLKFSENRGLAGQHMEGHNAWIKCGFDDGVFLLVGKLQPDLGGAILADNEDVDALRQRISEDPFVVEAVVTPEILEVTPGKADQRLQFLLD
jgi:uncharacterized protein YciI